MTPRLLAVFVVILGAIAGWSLWRSVHTRRALEEQIAGANARGARAAAAALAAQDQLSRLEAKRAGLVRDIEASAARPAPPRPKPAEARPAMPPAGATSLAETIRQWQEEQKRPEGQLKVLADRRARLPDTYEPFYRELRLTAAEVRAFEDILMRREENVMDLMAVAEAQGLTLRDSAVARLWESIHGDVEKQQRELLGDSGLGKLKDYARTAGIRDLVRNFAAMTTVFGDPISPRQIEQLVPAIAATSDSYRKGHQATGTSVDWEAALVAAARILTPRQLELIRTREPDGGGLFHAQWNRELVNATRMEKGKLASPGSGGSSR